MTDHELIVALKKVIMMHLPLFIKGIGEGL